MDRVGADFKMSVDSIHKKLGAKRLASFAALGSEDQLRGSSTSLTRRRLFILTTISLDPPMR